MATLNIRNMDRATAARIKEMGKARGWTIGETLEHIVAATVAIREQNDHDPDPTVTAVLDELGLNFVRR